MINSTINKFQFFQKLRMIRGKFDKIITPFLTIIYKINPNNCPKLILTGLGIANLKTHPEFYTLEKIINSIDTFNGAIIECGVYRGKTLLGIAHNLRNKNIKTYIYGFDSFSGNPNPTDEDKLENGKFHKRVQKDYFKDAHYKDLFNKIKLLGFSNRIILKKGYFENTLPKLKNKKFMLVHLDCSLYNSYKICLEFLYNRVLPGGYIVFDDYEKSDSDLPGAQKAINAFFKDKSEKIESFNNSKYPRYFIRKLE